MKGNTKNGLKINPTGDRKNYPVDKVNFLNLVPLNQTDQPRSYLIIGFDTEYQSTDNLKKGRIYSDNDVLSYQYSCSIINHLNEDNEETWEGIVLPDSYEIKDRISFQTFIEFIIGHGISNNPKIRIPRDIYLVSHFTRCDVPGFSDFSEDKDRSTLNFQNVRGSFVNVKQDLLKSLNDSESNDDIKVRIKVRDTLHISPQERFPDLAEVPIPLAIISVSLGSISNGFAYSTSLFLAVGIITLPSVSNPNECMNRLPSGVFLVYVPTNSASSTFRPNACALSLMSIHVSLGSCGSS
jgi:hypothetical protein